MSQATLLERVRQLCELAARQIDDPGAAVAVAAVHDRLFDPLRIAIVGRAKAGKSTVLNALVGERLAATDAAECTRLVTWYRHGIGYEVRAWLGSGGSREVQFRRDGRLVIMLDELDRRDVEHLEVRWPASRLERMVFVDTPGLASTDEVSAARSLRLLGLEADSVGEVDAVVYLLRHLQRRDIDFLEAFLDRAVAEPSPVNAIAVLSRADEIGGSRLDALDAAAAVARRYATDERLRIRCSTVIPVAGLIAETGATLREDEANVLRQLAALPSDELDDLLLSVDRFVDPDRSEVSSLARTELLARLGLFGVRWSIAAFRRGVVRSAVDLSGALLEVSGIGRLVELLERHFAARAGVLKAWAALAGLRAIARGLPREQAAAAQWLVAESEKLEASAHEFAELRLWHLVLSGTIQLDEGERGELEQLTSEGSPATRLGMPDTTEAEVVRDEASSRSARWRARAAHPLASREMADACEIVARSYEGVHAVLAREGAAANQALP
ncbi:MAG: GTPase [Chloroflexota bacterium]